MIKEIPTVRDSEHVICTSLLNGSENHCASAENETREKEKKNNTSYFLINFKDLNNN